METPSFEEVNRNIRKYNPNYFRKHYPEFFAFLKNKYPDVKKLTGALWLYYHGEEQPTCKYCGKRKASFRNWTRGFNEFCGQDCARRGTRDKAEATKRARYGGNGVSPDRIEKIKKTNIERYGVEHATMLPEITEKRKHTLKMRYGDEKYVNTEKIKQTMKERYGVEHALQKPEFLEKSQQTCMKHHGVRYPGQSREIMDRVIKTQIERYGGFGYASNVIKDKIIETNLKKYGRKYGFDYEKVKQTCIERYGDENPMIAKCACGEIKYQVYSHASQEFCRMMDEILCPTYTTQYATKGGEKCIQASKKYYVDYYIQELNVAIEFHGDFWHANPSRFKATDHCFPQNKEITAVDLWEIDRIKKEAIESAGIKLIVMWASEFKQCKDLKQWFITKLNKLDINISLNNND